MLKRLQKIIKKQLDVEVQKITLESSIVNDLGADSLDLIELIIAVEEEFDVQISDEEAEKIKTVKDIIDYLEKIK